ncbi:MAG: HD domain-containing protein, partial [Lachnospiraceae bacterium]
AVSLGLLKEDIDLAWLIGMLHDVGRFEQVRRYNTFEDAKSVDHAQMGIHVLWEEKRIRDYIGDSAEDDLIRLAITQHNVYRIPEDLTAREAMFCNIIRDADKVDIFRVNTEVALEDIYNVSTEELYSAVVTDRVMEDFYQHHAVLRAHKASPVDHVVGHISLVFELVYPISLRIALEQGYVDRLMHFASHNPVTRQQFGEIRQEMERYLKEVCEA